MELNYTNILLKISNLTTISSYIKGTLIFTLFTISKSSNNYIVIIGLIFVAIAVLVNSIVFIASLIAIYFAKTKEIKQQLWFAIAFQFANVPIAYAYFYYVINVNQFMYF